MPFQAMRRPLATGRICARPLRSPTVPRQTGSPGRQSDDTRQRRAAVDRQVDLHRHRPCPRGSTRDVVLAELHHPVALERAGMRREPPAQPVEPVAAQQFDRGGDRTPARRDLVALGTIGAKAVRDIPRR